MFCNASHENTSKSLLRGRLASLLDVGFGHRCAVSHWLRQYEPTPKLHFRFVAYQNGMWLRHYTAFGGISLRRNKPRCGVLSRPLRISRLASHPARHGVERCL